jgi:hypothetical protein
MGGEPGGARMVSAPPAAGPCFTENHHLVYANGKSRSRNTNHSLRLMPELPKLSEPEPTHPPTPLGLSTLSTHQGLARKTATRTTESTSPPHLKIVLVR